MKQIGRGGFGDTMKEFRLDGFRLWFIPTASGFELWTVDAGPFVMRRKHYKGQKGDEGPEFTEAYFIEAVTKNMLQNVVEYLHTIGEMLNTFEPIPDPPRPVADLFTEPEP